MLSAKFLLIALCSVFSQLLCSILLTLCSELPLGCALCSLLLLHLLSAPLNLLICSPPSTLYSRTLLNYLCSLVSYSFTTFLFFLHSPPSYTALFYPLSTLYYHLSTPFSPLSTLYSPLSRLCFLLSTPCSPISTLSSPLSSLYSFLSTL